MAITMTSGFTIKGKEAIDTRLIMSKEDMLNVKKTAMPEKYFCLCSDDNCFYIYDKSNEPNDESGLFKKVSSESGSDSTLEEDIVTKVDLGSIESGTIIKSGTSFTDLMKYIFSGYEAPYFEVLSGSEITYFEKNSSNNELIKLHITHGTNHISIIQLLRNNEIINEINEIPDEGIDIDQLIDNIDTDTDIIVKIDDGVKHFNYNISYKFVNPYYYGTVNSLDSLDIEMLTKLIVPKSEIKLNITSDNQYIVILVDKEYGDLTDINDGTFSNLSSFDKSELEVNGVEYLLYTSEVPITCDNFIYNIK